MIDAFYFLLTPPSCIARQRKPSLRGSAPAPGWFPVETYMTWRVLGDPSAVAFTGSTIALTVWGSTSVSHRSPAISSPPGSNRLSATYRPRSGRSFALRRRGARLRGLKRPLTDLMAFSPMTPRRSMMTWTLSSGARSLRCMKRRGDNYPSPWSPPSPSPRATACGTGPWSAAHHASCKSN